MVPYEAILQVSARMIAAIIFVSSIGTAINTEKNEDWLFIFSIFGVMPFTITAILALLNHSYSMWACILSFIIFGGVFTLVAYALFITK